MSYLIDGNNVMAQRVGWHRDKPGTRRVLMDELAEFALAKRARVAVVFDGAPEPHFPDGASYRGIKVFYSDRGSNADERIKRIVDSAKERSPLCGGSHECFALSVIEYNTDARRVERVLWVGAVESIKSMRKIPNAGA